MADGFTHPNPGLQPLTPALADVERWKSRFFVKGDAEAMASHLAEAMARAEVMRSKNLELLETLGRAVFLLAVLRAEILNGDKLLGRAHEIDAVLAEITDRLN